MPSKSQCWTDAEVRALLDGGTVEVWRVAKKAGLDCLSGCDCWHSGLEQCAAEIAKRAPIQPGQTVTVREAAYIAPVNFAEGGNALDHQGRKRTVGYAADMDWDSVRCAKDYGVQKTHESKMPLWASRIAAPCVSVRAVQRDGVWGWEYTYERSE